MIKRRYKIYKGERPSGGQVKYWRHVKTVNTLAEANNYVHSRNYRDIYEISIETINDQT